MDCFLQQQHGSVYTVTLTDVKKEELKKNIYHNTTWDEKELVRSAAACNVKTSGLIWFSVYVSQCLLSQLWIGLLFLSLCSCGRKVSRKQVHRSLWAISVLGEYDTRDRQVKRYEADLWTLCGWGQERQSPYSKSSSAAQTHRCLPVGLSKMSDMTVSAFPSFPSNPFHFVSSLMSHHFN